MANKGRWTNQHMEITDGVETVKSFFPVMFEDDFLGYKLEEYVANENTVAKWTTVYDATMTKWALVANAANGIIQADLAATDEVERSVLYFGDQLPFNINYGLIFEARVACKALATTGTEKAELIWGMAGADNADPDAITTNLWFKCHGDANIVWETDDTHVDDDDNDTGVDAVAGTYNIYRIDCTVPTVPKFYIDGVLVGTAAMALVVDHGAVQPYFAVQKPKAAANTGVGGLYVDYVRIWQKRSA